MLKIKELKVKIGSKQILTGLDLNIEKKEIHVIMGPNGVGKSTICKAIMGDPNYEVSGSIILDKEEINNLDVTSRSRMGIYVVNQNPIAIEGVTNAEMLRTVLKEKTGKYIPIYEFDQKMQKICDKLNIPVSFVHREINVGMSGGERKKNELLHLYMLEPKLIILDEIDSGLDVDSLKIVAESIKEYYHDHDCSILIITHHVNILKYLKPKFIHVLINGKITASGGMDIVKVIEKNGFKTFTERHVSNE